MQARIPTDGQLAFDKKNETGDIINVEHCLFRAIHSFDKKIETGPVGHPLKVEPAKSANPRFLSKIDQQLIEGAGEVF